MSDTSERKLQSSRDKAGPATSRQNAAVAGISQPFLSSAGPARTPEISLVKRGSRVRIPPSASFSKAKSGLFCLLSGLARVQNAYIPDPRSGRAGVGRFGPGNRRSSLDRESGSGWCLVLARVAHGGGQVMAAGNSVAVIGAKTGDLIDNIAVGSQPGAIAFGAGSIWVANVGDGSVSRIDPRAHRVVRTLSTASASRRWRPPAIEFGPWAPARPLPRAHRRWRRGSRGRVA
jgi:DNA-binding beta-propeller fold protein YncE